METASSELTFMQSLKTEELRVFLLELSHALTIAARVLTADGQVELGLIRGRAINELQHLITQYLIRVERGHENRGWLMVIAKQLASQNDDVLNHQIRMAWTASCASIGQR